MLDKRSLCLLLCLATRASSTRSAVRSTMTNNEKSCKTNLRPDIHDVDAGDELAQKAVQFGAFDVAIAWMQPRKKVVD